MIKKRYKSLIIENYYSLFEGKKQAVQILNKQYYKDSKKIVDFLETLDPTSPKNKYIELYAKLFVNYFEPVGDSINIDKKLKKFKQYIEDENVQENIKDIEHRNLKIDTKRIETLEDLVKELKKAVHTITKSKAKKGISGLKKNIDYIEIPTVDNNLQAYIPLNYQASKVIASTKVGGCEGKWCTAYQKSDHHWREFIGDKAGILVYIINNRPDANLNEYKLALFYNNNKIDIDFYDANDKRLYTQPPTDITKYIYKNWDTIRDKIPLEGIEALKDKYLRGLVPFSEIEDSLSYSEFIDLMPHVKYQDITNFNKEYDGWFTYYYLQGKITLKKLLDMGDVDDKRIKNIKDVIGIHYNDFDDFARSHYLPDSLKRAIEYYLTDDASIWTDYWETDFYNSDVLDYFENYLEKKDYDIIEKKLPGFKNLIKEKSYGEIEDHYLELDLNDELDDLMRDFHNSIESAMKDDAYEHEKNRIMSSLDDIFPIVELKNGELILGVYASDFFNYLLEDLYNESYRFYLSDYIYETFNSLISEISYYIDDRYSPYPDKNVVLDYFRNM